MVWSLLYLFDLRARAPAVVQLPPAVVISRILLAHHIGSVIVAAVNLAIILALGLPLVESMLLVSFHWVDCIQRYLLNALVCDDVAERVHVNVILASFIDRQLGHLLLLCFRRFHPLCGWIVLRICNPARFSGFG